MRGWGLIAGLVVVGVVVGASGVVLSTFVNQYTSTESFCTSCHSMAPIGADPHYQHSAHRSNAVGVLANCSDCHVPATNWFVETYTHASAGLRDVIAEYFTNVSEPSKWAKRVPALANEVREQMRSQDSVTCRKCHDAAVIRPATESGSAAHAMMLAQGHMTCIDCHFNLVHAPVPPSSSFLQGSGLDRDNR
jgi:nitrate/TMAO reductase-like tetraheme cytochrome c subunit